MKFNFILFLPFLLDSETLTPVNIPDNASYDRPEDGGRKKNKHFGDIIQVRENPKIEKSKSSESKVG